MSGFNGKCMCASLAAGLVVLGAAVAFSAESAGEVRDIGAERAAWLMQRGGVETLAALDRIQQPGEFGGGGAADARSPSLAGGGSALPVLASLVLPGAGEAMLGHKRGYFMMALDIFAWTRVAKNHSDGGDIRDEYYAFADAHYSNARLVEAYKISPDDPNDPRAGMGDEYFPLVDAMNDTNDLDHLPLYVSREADRREFYENLGKWNQFVFGWDDFVRPGELPGFTPTGDQKIDLEQPGISENRETYRLMRGASNDAFQRRDRWLYVNIGLRIFSVLQTAYLDGLLGGGDDRLSVAGHEIQIIAQPTGIRRATVAAAVSF